MLPTEDLFVYVYVLIHDLITAGAIAIPARPGPEPACTDAELPRGLEVAATKVMTALSPAAVGSPRAGTRRPGRRFRAGGPRGRPSRTGLPPGACQHRRAGT